jgi:hypothetical protein
MNTFNIKASLTNKQAKDFFVPLNDLLRNCGPKVVIRFLKDKKIVIKSISEQRDLIQFINYGDSISSLFESENDYRVGIYDLSEFVNLFKIFESGLEFRFINAEKKLEFINTNNGEEQSLQYYICDETVVPKPPEAIDFSKVTWNTTFKWIPSKFETLSNAMKNLKYPNIIIVGKANDSFITVSITESDIKTTTFKSRINVDNPITSSFSVILDKAKFINIVSGLIKEFDISICEKIVLLTGKTDLYSSEYILFPLKK